MVTKFLGRFAGVAAVGLCAALRLCCELPLSERAAPVRVATSAGHARVEEGRAMLHDVVPGIAGLKARSVVPMSAGLTLCGVDLVPLGMSLPWPPGETTPRTAALRVAKLAVGVVRDVGIVRALWTAAGRVG